MRTIPFRHDCSENIRDYKVSIECYREALFEPDAVMIDMGYVPYLRPFGLNLLSGMICDLLRNGQEVSLVPPQSKQVQQYLTDQGFYAEFQVGSSGSLKRTLKSTSVGLRRLDERNYSYLSDVALWLNKNSRIPLERVKDMVMVTMPEVINNVFDHSDSPFGCYVCAEAYPKEHRLMLSVMDFGVGFLYRLGDLYPQLHSDAEAIALAVKDGISSKRSKRNAGRGLHILSEWIRHREGELEIISQDGHWIQDSTGRTRTENLPFSFPGTCINLCVHTAKLPAQQDYDRRPYD
jgi:hypothetical protein